MAETNPSSENHAFERRIHRSWDLQRKKKSQGRVPIWALLIILAGLVALFVYLLVTALYQA